MCMRVNAHLCVRVVNAGNIQKPFTFLKQIKKKAKKVMLILERLLNASHLITFFY